MDLDKMIHERRIELHKTYARQVEEIHSYKTIEDSLPTFLQLRSVTAKIVIDNFNDLRILMPWNIMGRVFLTEILKENGWEITTDNPRDATSKTWITYYRKNDVELELWMKADYNPEGVENQCKIVKLGTKTVTFEQSVYDVVCPGDS